MMNLVELGASGAETFKGNLTKIADTVGNAAEGIKNSSIFKQAEEMLTKNSVIEFSKNIAEYVKENNLPKYVENIAEDLKNGKSLNETLENEVTRKMDSLKELSENTVETAKKTPAGKLVNFVKELFGLK